MGLLLSVLSFGINFTIAVLNLEGKYPNDKAWLKIFCSNLIALGGKFFNIVLFILVSPGVSFLKVFIVVSISLKLIKASMSDLPCSRFRSDEL